MGASGHWAVIGKACARRNFRERSDDRGMNRNTFKSCNIVGEIPGFTYLWGFSRGSVLSLRTFRIELSG